MLKKLPDCLDYGRAMLILHKKLVIIVVGVQVAGGMEPGVN